MFTPHIISLIPKKKKKKLFQFSDFFLSFFLSKLFFFCWINELFHFLILTTYIISRDYSRPIMASSLYEYICMYVDILIQELLHPENI